MQVEEQKGEQRRSAGARQNGKEAEVRSIAREAGTNNFEAERQAGRQAGRKA